MERIDTWILMCMALWIGSCIIVNAIIQRSSKIKKLMKENDGLARELKKAMCAYRDMQKERDAVIARDEANRCHYVRVRDDEIERLQFEVRAWEKKYNTLERVLNQLWPCGDRSVEDCD